MSDIKDWSTSAESNNSAPPDGFPEGQAPSSVNNSARAMMAAIRTQHEDSAWIDLGQTPTYVSATSFTLAGDVASAYGAGRRIRCTDSSTLYGEIVSAVYTSLTTVTVVLDSGSLSGSLSAVAVGILDENSKPLSRAAVDIVDIIYPVGSVYVSTVATNPNTLFGTGTWVATGEGRVLVGVGTSDKAFALDDTGGASDAIVPAHTHTITDPGHTHTIDHGASAGGAGVEQGNPSVAGASTNSSTTGITETNSAGVSATDGNLQPYLTVHMWERTA